VERKFDVVVIGSGPAGYKASKLLLKRGLSVCIVEKEVFGGLCLNAGCIPKDMLYGIALSLQRIKNLKGNTVSLSWEETLKQVQSKILRLRKLAEDQLRSKGLAIVYGEAELIEEKKVKVGRTTLTADYIILACGSKPPTEGILPEDILKGKVIPEGRVSIKGNDPSAYELAFILKAFDREVVLEVKEGLLSSFPQISETIYLKLETALENCGVVIVENLSGEGFLINAEKRKPNLCPQRFPFIKLTSDGYADTDPYLETSVPGVYAVGDLVPPQGAGFAFEKARVAVSNILYGKSFRFDPSKIPFLITSACEVGFVGDINKVARFEYKPLSVNPKIFVNHEGGILQIGYDESDKPVFIAGAGHGLCEILNVFSAVLGGWFSHPSYGEILEEILAPIV